jgi:hypothetical protein
MQTTLGGTLVIYQGEEISIRNSPNSWPIEDFKDIESINYWKCLDLYSNDKERLAHDRRIIVYESARSCENANAMVFQNKRWIVRSGCQALDASHG